ncbi:MAG: CoA pyrophosphatase [Deltaproteobacteria bacterium]|nr:CoA pyrophosphatase [Deltaproteobacteria bacterium]MBW2359447.1 CoA pyrophosphatase [Deltaproteobacteria bacterium]
MPRVETIRSAMAGYAPVLQPPGSMNAAVAVTLCEDERGTNLLLIRRAERDGDPWSGHVSFPGGRVDASDASLRHAAERETREEVGLDLSTGEWLGQLDDLRGVAVPMVVSAFVFTLERPAPLVLSDEVRRAFWVPLDELLDSSRHVTEPFDYQGRAVKLPAIDVGDGDRPPLWGLTYHFLEKFFSLLGCRLPETLWRDDLQRPAQGGD